MSTNSVLPTIPPILETLVTAADTNPGGDLFGGYMLAQMDLAGGSVAYARAQSRVVTAGIQDVDFIKPVLLADRLRIYAVVEREGRTSIRCRLEAWALRKNTENIEKVAEGVYTFVSVDDQFRPQPLHQMIAA